jgi:hypothetical protein
MAQNSLFPKDALNTNLTAPVSNVQVQGAVNTSLTTQTRSAGIQNFTESLSALARKKLANTIHNDTITAELAAAYDKEMPGNLDPLAQLAFSLSVDRKTQAQGINSLDEYSKIEGAAFLNDERVPRLQRMTNFKNGALQLLNATKGSISNINAKEIFSGLDTAFSKLVSDANTSLALDKKQEDLSVNASAISSAVKAQLSIVQALSPEISKNSIDGQPLSAEAFVSKHRTFTADWIGKSVSTKKFFNGIVNQVLATKPNTNVSDVKATALAIVGDELLKLVRSNPELAKPAVMTKLLNSVKGSTKDSTLASEILSRSDDGKILGTIVNNFSTKLASILKGIDAETKAASTENDNTIGDGILDNIADLTQKQALETVKGIVDTGEQIKITNFINDHFKAGPKLSIGSQAFADAMKLAPTLLVDGKMTSEAKASIYRLGGSYNLSNDAIRNLVSSNDPETKIGKQRTAIKSSFTISTLRSEFKGTLVGLLKSSKFGDIAKAFGGVDLDDPVAVLSLTRAIGDVDVRDKVAQILQSNLQFSKYLDNLARDNPDADISVLEDKASKRFLDLQNKALGIVQAPEVPIENKDPVGPTASGAATFKTKNEIVKTVLEKSTPDALQTYIDHSVSQLEEAEDLRKQAAIASGVTPSTTSERVRAIIALGGNSPREIVDNREILLRSNPDARRILQAQDNFVNDVDTSDELIRVGSLTLTDRDVERAGPAILKGGQEVWDSFADFFDSFRVFSKDRVPPEEVQDDTEVALKIKDYSLRIPEEKGVAVTNKAIDIAISALGDDKGILKFIGNKESNNGEHPETFRKGYHGGIFQVDLIGFKSTQDVESHPRLEAKFKLIKESTGIDWPKVKWEDLRKPVYSAIASRLFLSNIAAPIPDTDKERRQYWKEHYNTKAGKGKVN